MHLLQTLLILLLVCAISTFTHQTIDVVTNQDPWTERLPHLLSRVKTLQTHTRTISTTVTERNLANEGIIYRLTATPSAPKPGFATGIIYQIKVTPTPSPPTPISREFDDIAATERIAPRDVNITTTIAVLTTTFTPPEQSCHAPKVIWQLTYGYTNQATFGCENGTLVPYKSDMTTLAMVKG